MERLQRDLRDIASQSNEATHRIWIAARGLPDDKLIEVIGAIAVIQECIDRAKAMADRVKAGDVQPLS